MENKREKIMSSLRRNNLWVQAIFVIVTTIMGGVFTNGISNIIFNKKQTLLSMLGQISFKYYILLIVYVALFFTYIWFQDYVKSFPDKSMAKKRATIINNILEAITKALFTVKYKELEISAVIQICNKKERKVTYNYNTISNNILTNKIPIDFGDVGRICVAEKNFFIKEYKYSEWSSQSYEYKKIVPKDLRVIIAQPICNDEEVIAVLEFDIFETTKESKRNSSKEGYLTDTIKVDDIMRSLNNHRFQTVLDKLSEAVSYLIDDKQA